MSTSPSQSNPTTTSATDAQSKWHGEVLTVPNIISMLRIAGSLVLILLAAVNELNWFVGSFLFLALTDWIDGKLAFLLNQRTELGARLDSASDAVLFSALLVGTIVLRGDVVLMQAFWIGTALLTYTISMVFGLWKFGRTPSYHTRAAKSCWLLTTVGVLTLLWDIALWPFQLAMVAVSITNVEATLISCVLNEWQPNVTSLYHAVRDRRESTESMCPSGRELSNGAVDRPTHESRQSYSGS